jgi:hypothetical protein
MLLVLALRFNQSINQPRDMYACRNATPMEREPNKSGKWQVDVSSGRFVDYSTSIESRRRSLRLSYTGLSSSSF